MSSNWSKVGSGSGSAAGRVVGAVSATSSSAVGRRRRAGAPAGADFADAPLVGVATVGLALFRPGSISGPIGRPGSILSRRPGSAGDGDEIVQTRLGRLHGGADGVAVDAVGSHGVGERAVGPVADHDRLRGGQLGEGIGVAAHVEDEPEPARHLAAIVEQLDADERRAGRRTACQSTDVFSQQACQLLRKSATPGSLRPSTTTYKQQRRSSRPNGSVVASYDWIAAAVIMVISLVRRTPPKPERRTNSFRWSSGGGDDGCRSAQAR